ncbi:MAG: glycosyltransferase [Gallionella sp.]|jgi:glycosyltransferase involved in cell wall biosynthesis
MQNISNKDRSSDYITGLVSVVIPTYNQVDFVKETIDSVLEQDYPKLQIIVTDDGSTDGTVQIIQDYVRQYPDKVVAVVSEKNTGIPANFNRGFRQVKGEYIAWLGGDDLMLPGKISKQVKLMQQRPDAVGCCHDAEVFQSHDGKVIGAFCQLMNGQPKYKEGGVELRFEQNYFTLPSTVMIRSIAAPLHGFDERLKYQNDWLFDVEVFRQGKCIPINEILGRYRRHERNVTGNSSLLNSGPEEVMISLAIIESRYPDLYRYVSKRRKQMYLSLAVRSFRNADLRGARNFLLAAIRSGFVLQGMVVLLALLLFGKYISTQLSLSPYSRSHFFVKLNKIFWKA